jgi:cytochrome c oxidase assembly protein subunit 15
VTTQVAPEPATGLGRRRLTGWTLSFVALRRLVIAALIANVGIVVTGGAVRLTGSGLGCPTWPKCTDSSLTPRNVSTFHGTIEFTNRQLTFVVGLVGVLVLVAAWRQRRERPLAVVGFLGIPAQAVLGGITVLTDLNPYAVACHFLLSMVVLAVYSVLLSRLVGGRATDVPAAAAWAARALVCLTGLVLVLGTVVTGSGPHAGDLQAGRLHRIHLSPAAASQLHADAVTALIGLTLGVIALAYALRRPLLARAAVVLFVVELLQGGLGWLQYFVGVPPLLVAVHMLGACLVWLGALRVWLLVEPAVARRSVPA